MTKAQAKKLEMILAKLEALQNQIEDRSAQYEIGAAKSQLLRVLSKGAK